MNWKDRIEAQIAFFRLGTHHHVCKEDATMFADNVQALLDVATAADALTYADAVTGAETWGEMKEALNKLREERDDE